MPVLGGNRKAARDALLIVFPSAISVAEAARRRADFYRAKAEAARSRYDAYIAPADSADDMA